MPAGPVREVRLGLVARDARDGSFDPDLTVELGPVEERRGVRVRVELLGLAAVVVGVEDQPALVEATQEHDTRRRPPVPGRGRDGHRRGLVVSGDLRVGVPSFELRKRARIDVALVEFLG